MECFSNPPHHVKTISNQGKALRTHRICAKPSRHRGKCQDGWMAIQMSYHCSWVLSCGVYSITVSVVTLQVLCKYVILFTIDLDSVLFVLWHVGASVDAVLCSQIGIHWRVQPPPLSFCHHHRCVELSQARHLTDRQMETVDFDCTTSIRSRPPTAA